MKLIAELNEEIQILTEGSGESKKYFIEGVFLQADIKNRNGRVYPLNILKEEVERYTKEYVDQKRAFGELCHPSSPQINLERVSHMINSLKLEGSNYVGKAKIMDTPYGKIAKNLIDEGARLGVSSRGLGSLEEKNGVSYVADDFRLATAADIVADPSAPDAFVRGIMEDKEWIYESGVWKEVQIEKTKKFISKTSQRKLEEAKLVAFQKFLRDL